MRVLHNGCEDAGDPMRHRFHAICPYFAMFPEDFVREHLALGSNDGVVFDPFSGRGTTVFESLLNGRQAYGTDVNPVAVCLSNAKADPPTHREAWERLQELEDSPLLEDACLEKNEFFRMAFYPDTLQQILHMRRLLDWKNNRVDGFLAALMLGTLHGESHVSPRYLSNRMPRTISTKPAYSVRWWRTHGYEAPSRDVFNILRGQTDFRFASCPARLRGHVAMADARSAGVTFPELTNSVDLIITSPPYLDTTNFEEDQWLRLWFLGGEDRPIYGRKSDHRHLKSDSYWRFLREAWAGLTPLLRDEAHLVIRLGGKKLRHEIIRDNLISSLSVGLTRTVELVSEICTPITGNQIRSFRPGVVTPSKESDFIFALS